MSVLRFHEFEKNRFEKIKNVLMSGLELIEYADVCLCWQKLGTMTMCCSKSSALTLS